MNLSKTVSYAFIWNNCQVLLFKNVIGNTPNCPWSKHKKKKINKITIKKSQNKTNQIVSHSEKHLRPIAVKSEGATSACWLPKRISSETSFSISFFVRYVLFFIFFSLPSNKRIFFTGCFCLSWHWPAPVCHSHCCSPIWARPQSPRTCPSRPLRSRGR